MANKFIRDIVKIGKKGQITIPKIIRDEDSLEEDDTMVVTHMPSGDIILRKKKKIDPEDMMLEAIKAAPVFDFEKAWAEVQRERKAERS